MPVKSRSLTMFYILKNMLIVLLLTSFAAHFTALRHGVCARKQGGKQ